MNNSTLIITGPTGVGKTAVSAIIQNGTERCANIDVDTVKHFLLGKSFIYDDSPKGIEQWKLLGRNLGMLASNYSDTGYDVIVHGVLTVEGWESFDSQAKPTKRILLVADVEETVKRDDSREEKSKQGEQRVREHYQYVSSNSYFDGFTKIDSSGQSPEETARLVTEQSGF